MRWRKFLVFICSCLCVYTFLLQDVICHYFKMCRKPTVIETVFQKLISVPTCHCPIHLPQETSLFYIWCIFSLSALHSSLNKMFCWLERKLFDPFNGHLSSDKLHLHSVKSLKFPFFSPVANWRRSPLITSFLTGHVTRSSQELNVSSGFLWLREEP